MKIDLNMNTITFKGAKAGQTTELTINPNFIGMVHLLPNGTNNWKIKITFVSGQSEIFLYDTETEAREQYNHILSHIG